MRKSPYKSLCVFQACGSVWGCTLFLFNTGGGFMRKIIISTILIITMMIGVSPPCIVSAETTDIGVNKILLDSILNNRS